MHMLRVESSRNVTEYTSKYVHRHPKTCSHRRPRRGHHLQEKLVVFCLERLARREQTITVYAIFNENIPTHLQVGIFLLGSVPAASMNNFQMKGYLIWCEFVNLTAVTHEIELA